MSDPVSPPSRAASTLATGETRFLEAGFLGPRARPAAGTPLYVHLPFCAAKCHYCDFFSVAAEGHDRGAMIAAILREAELFAPLRSSWPAERVGIFFRHWHWRVRCGFRVGAFTGWVRPRAWKAV